MMNTSDPAAATITPSPNAARRLLLTSILAGYACSFLTIPSVLAAPDNAQKLPPAFLNVSRFLTGHAVLDMSQAMRLYAALLTNNASFDTEMSQLADFIAQNKSDPLTLQLALDEAKAPFAKLPALIATAWFVGVVGGGKTARCITYETSLMHVAVADRLRPPSYAYGPYGSWSRNPQTVTLTAA
ncbi:sugar dehydrogenase complex small subunit [Herbaspirillum sp. RTI4]|uniref:sugar dehydrogenase complex small subunit n=1 Tax=Herbaspirillum sp. RTI4 TaxID=3048640 RepID=UPI002AB49674|nr:sugar dehydrogenase complex small subunit [Herbaspirillum sp. RTI4]MDY7577652.1 sugar dehydrogenase complex small subunit [Herbaspirillum sp. RTI4]MEA9982182.1 sugar dehydrogenase complex small subunit [Herbaspirillum sp. RTI4]